MLKSREELLEQLRKLQTLAKRAAGTPEAAVARRKMREVMHRYGISVSELRPAPATKSSSAPTKVSSTSTPVTITVKLGDLRIRWKL